MITSIRAQKFPAALFTLVTLALTHFNVGASTEPALIEVMVLGTYHMSNPGQDLVNAKVDDVTTTRRQQELADVANRLAAFKPTKIAVEVAPSGGSYTVSTYRQFSPALLLKDRNEITQIGYRLAHQLGHGDVYAIDERNPGIDYFPFAKVQAYAKSAEREPVLAKMIADVQAESKSFESRQGTQTVTQLLASLNEPNVISKKQQFYTGLMSFGQDAKGSVDARWPGAELNAAWYLRNAKIFAKLTQVAKPGDRIVVLFGEGHAYQLREFVGTTKGYRLIEANRYLLP